MTNNSLLKCSAAFLILSLYIWLFGFTAEIGGDKTPEYFADEGREFQIQEAPVTATPAQAEQMPPSAVVPPDSERRPSLADMPGVAYEFETTTAAPPVSSETVETTTPEITTTAKTTTTEKTTTSAATSAVPPEITTTTTEKTTTAPPDSKSPQITVFDGATGKNVTGSELSVISRLVQSEIGSSFDREAIKAQAVAAYTYCLLYQNNGQYANVRLSASASDLVTDCVRSVLGEAVYYKGEIIQAVYHASSAGYTASAVNVWGQDLPYLRSVACELDTRFDPNYGVTRSFTSGDIMARVLENTGIQMTGDPADWIKILDYNDHVYVGNMTLGGKGEYEKNGGTTKITGKIFRDIMGTTDLRSSAFDVAYDAARDVFTFTTYGYGHGVGMSQHGANLLAKYEGYNYKQILQFYYTGTEIK